MGFFRMQNRRLRFGGGLAPNDIPGLVGWWKLDDASGALVDSSGEGNDGTAGGGPTYGVAGKIGTALSFDGIDDYVDLSNPASLTITEQISILAWVYEIGGDASGDAVERIVDKNNAYAFDFDHTAFGTGNLGLYNGTSWTDLPYITTLQADTWLHLAGTYDGTTMRVYLNGVEDSNKAGPASINGSANDVNIGGRAGIVTFDGSIDDVLIYNVALLPAQITQIYNYRG